MAFFAAAMAAPAAASAEAQAPAAPVVILEARRLPAVYLDDRARPAGCGVRLEAEAGGERYAASLVLWRVEPGTALRLLVRRENGGGDALPVASAGVSLAGGEAGIEFSAIAVRPGGAFEAQAASGPDYGFFMQRAMLAGVRIEFTPPGGGRIALAASGPAPQSVRAAYLNCAGDLYEQAR